MKSKPAIVVTAYNRPRSLLRILGSLSGMKAAEDVPLIISIDNKSPDNHDVLTIAKDYHWPYGQKEVIYRKEHLGLRKHIIACGGLSRTYGSVIILEDDLLVSPFFYDYALRAMEFYGKDEGIGGISLYNQPINEMNQLPFSPIYDDSDVYFLQFPSSWGQLWTESQWNQFIEWYNEGQDIANIVPKGMLNWSESSWKKYYSAYLIVKGKYFVFPRQSLTTNFNDPGTHLTSMVNFDGQSQLRLCQDGYRFKKLESSYCKYDQYLEFDPDCLKQLVPDLAGYEFETDLYGLKDTEVIKTSHVITSKSSSQVIRGYRRSLKPHEMNIILNLPGDDLLLCRTEHMKPLKNRYDRLILDHQYYYNRYFVNWKIRIYFKLSELISKLKIRTK
ncbi:MAG: hypothetical protein R6W31_08230 [Bacteroidales bacterium]